MKEGRAQNGNNTAKAKVSVPEYAKGRWLGTASGYVSLSLKRRAETGGEGGGGIGRVCGKGSWPVA